MPFTQLLDLASFCDPSGDTLGSNHFKLDQIILSWQRQVSRGNYVPASQGTSFQSEGRRNFIIIAVTIEKSVSVSLHSLVGFDKLELICEQTKLRSHSPNSAASGRAWNLQSLSLHPGWKVPVVPDVTD